MTIFYNGEPTELPEKEMTLEGLAAWKEIPSQGSAIAINDKLIRKTQWPVTILQPLDRVTVISAAFGG